MSQDTSFVLTASDSKSLFVDCWPGKAQNKKVLFIVHGYTEHSGRYQHIPKFLGDQFQKFYAMDLRGHGRSGGLRGDAASFDLFVEDVKLVTAEIQKREGDNPLYLMAHSFGGLVALQVLLKERKLPFQNAVVSAPLLGIAVKIPKYKLALANVLAKTVSQIQLSNEINPSFLSHDPMIVEAYVNDRLVHNKMTPRLFKDLLRVIDETKTQTGPLACPTLFLIPGDDRVVDSNTTLDFYRNIKDRNKEIRQYPEMYHEIFNEIGKEKVFEDIKNWLL